MKKLSARPRFPGRPRSTADAPAPTRRTSLERFAERAATEAQDHEAPALEVGVGGRSFAPLFDADRYRSISIDVRSAGRHYPGFVPNRPIDMLPVDNGQFSVVLCTGALARSPEPSGFMAELSRGLAERGRLFLAAPLIVPEPTAFGPPGRHRFGLNYLLEVAGFAIEDLMPVERSASYAVVARKRELPCGARRRTDAGRPPNLV